MPETPDTTPATARNALQGAPGADTPALQRIEARAAEVGGIAIHRVVPTRQRRVIGPWCFLDHAGPAEFTDAQPGMQVGPHPHIGLQTFTWMIEGEILHRDSLGSEQLIRPGQVNLMTAGQGIVHTETQPEGQTHLHAAQLWIALPADQRNIAPRFEHYPDLPQWVEQGVSCTLLAGSLAGHRAPTQVHSPLIGLDLVWPQAGAIEIPLEAGFEHGILTLQGELQIDDQAVGTDTLIYLDAGRRSLVIQGAAGSRALLLGGAPLSHEVLIWWNFVGAEKAEIAQAQRDWEAHDPRFGEVPGAEGMARLMPPPLPWPGV